MDDRQSKLLIGAIALLVLAGAAWFFFIKDGPRSGIADRPDTKAAGAGPRTPAVNGMRTGAPAGGAPGGAPAPPSGE